MSTKLTAILQTSRNIYEAEKEKFLDTLAEFIEDKKISITQGDHYCFTIEVFPSGADENGRLISNFYLISNTTAPIHDEFSKHKYSSSILDKESVFKFLKSEYHAETFNLRANSTVSFAKIILPFA